MLKLWTQTIVAPVVASFLFILVFGLSLSGRIRQVHGVDYRVFIVPGLVTMAMVQAAYSNNASSVFQARFDRYLNDVLASPMRNWQINLGLSLGGIVRALLIGISLLALAIPITGVPIRQPLVLVTAVGLGLTLFASLGVVVGIYAKSWDHAGFVQNILIVPLSFLGGVFYSVDTLPSPWREVSHANPVFYLVQAVRYGFLGIGDVPIGLALGITAVLAGVTVTWSAWLFASGKSSSPSIHRVELRHLRYFVAVAEELHFHRAAERLHISQPPLSQQIRALETELGVELLRRNRRRVELTEAGTAFLGEARAILTRVQQAGDLARRVARGEVGKLSVGFVGSAMYATLPEILRAFRDEHPDVELQLRPFPTAPQLEALRDGRIDVGFLRPPVGSSGLEIETIQRETIVVALPRSHPLAHAQSVGITQLQNETFVLLARTESPGVYDSLALTLSELAGNPRAVQEADDMQTLIGLVAAGIGVALVPISVSLLHRPGVVYRPLSGRAPTVELALAWRSGPLSPVVAAFLAIARIAAAR